MIAYPATSGEKYVCNSCGYKWVSKKNFGSPSICPNCKERNIINYCNTKEYHNLKEYRKKQMQKEEI